MGAIREIYGRVPALAKAVPWVALLVFAAELVQHAAEIRLGMYEHGSLAPDARRTRLLFGLAKVLVILAALIFALRWWRFDGDWRRAARPTLALFKGLAILLLVQAGAEILLALLGRLAGAALGGGPRIVPLVTAGPLLLWLFLATLLYPWYVGLLTEDRTMTLRRSAAGTRGRMWASFGLLLAGILPAMALHYALGYAAEGRGEPLVWALMLVDAAVVAFLALALASTYFTLYRRAAERVAA
jgi:hypothetical protein